jgi:hypothetical protein
MKNLVYIGLLLIFLSMISILIISMNFSSIISECIEYACDSDNVFLNMIFGFFITGIFVIIDVLIVYLLYRERPWRSGKEGKAGQAYKSAPAKNKTAKKTADMKSRLHDLESAKEETEKQYYKGKFDAKTFEKMLNNYDQKIIEIQAKIKNIKSKKKTNNKNRKKKK